MAPRKTTNQGRPSRLTSVILRDGQPTKVTDAILADIRDGLPLDLAIKRSGTTTVCAGDWFREAARVSERQLVNPRHPVTAHERRLLEFSTAVDQARAEAERDCWALLERIAQGGRRRRVVIKTDPSRRDPTTGQPLVIEQQIIEEDLLPSFNAVRWKLENSYGRAIPLAVRVENGALTDEERAQQMLDGLEAFLAEHATDPSTNGHTDPQ